MLKIKPLSDDEISQKVETPTLSRYVQISDPSDANRFCVVPSKYVKTNFLERMKSFRVYADDVWVISFPKCGTTWAIEMVWLLVNNLNFDLARKIHQNDRAPFIERGGIFNAIDSDSIAIAEKLERPRVIKSHLQTFLLPNELLTSGAKIVYVSRNPKDAAISFYHHYRHLEGYAGSKEDFLNAFLSNKVLFSPINGQTLDFWKLSKSNSNVLYVFYEDMKRSLEDEMRRVMKFLGKDFSQEEIGKLCEYLSFDSMRRNPSCNFEVPNKADGGEKFQFIRKGETGSHKQEMSAEESERFDAFIKCDEFELNNFAYKC